MDQIANAEVFGSDSTPMTPHRKPSFQKSGQSATSVSSHGGSSDLSLKEGHESSSSLTSDSESESFNSSGEAYFSLPINTDHKKMHHKIFEVEAEVPSFEEKLGRDTEIAKEYGDYHELLGRVIKYEEELRVSKIKLQLSEDEVTRLRIELEKSESFAVLAETSQSQLESAYEEIKMMEAALETERKRVLELQQEAELNEEIRGQLKLAQEEVTKLKTHINLESTQVSDLHAKIMRYESEIADRYNDLRALQDAMDRLQEDYFLEKSQLLSDTFSLSEKQNVLEARLREWETECKYLEDKLRQCEADKMEMMHVHDVKEIGLQGEINELKKEVIDRVGHTEDLNKNFDNLKFKYDMLMAEKDGLNDKVNTLVADMSSRECQVKQMEEQLWQLQNEHTELIARHESANKLIQELRSKVAGLEKEVDKQIVEISVGAEEKREAIRQLCFSLEHYRSWYIELRQAFVAHKRLAVMTS